jgi:hypothetical protein
MAAASSSNDLKAANRRAITSSWFCSCIAATVHQTHALERLGVTALEHQPALNALSSTAWFCDHPGSALIKTEATIITKPAGSCPLHASWR